MFTTADCDKWRLNPGINPLSGRNITSKDPIFYQLKRACGGKAPMANPQRNVKMKCQNYRVNMKNVAYGGSPRCKSNKKLFTDTNCKKWQLNPEINPLTGRKITVGDPIYNKFMKECGIKLPPPKLSPKQIAREFAEYGFPNYPPPNTDTSVNFRPKLSAIPMMYNEPIIVHNPTPLPMPLMSNMRMRMPLMSNMRMIEYNPTPMSNMPRRTPKSKSIKRTQPIVSNDTSDGSSNYASAKSYQDLESIMNVHPKNRSMVPTQDDVSDYASAKSYQDLESIMDDQPRMSIEDMASKGLTYLISKSGIQNFDEKLLNRILLSSAINGHLDTMRLAKTWGAKDYDSAFIGAAKTGHLSAMRLLKKWGVKDYELAFRAAAMSGHVNIMRILKEWGAKDYDWALVYAAKNGQIPAMRLLNEMGATRYKWALKYAKKANQSQAVSLLEMWINPHHSRSSYSVYDLSFLDE